jgi:hypothetical protein
MEAFMGCFAHLGASDFLTEATTGYDALLTKLVADVTGLGADGINPDMGKSDFQALARRVNAVITNFKSQNGSTDTALGTKIKAFTNALAAYRLDTENVDILNTLSTAAGELKIAFTTAATGAALSSCTYFSNLNTIITNVNSVLNSIISVADASRKRLIRDMLEGKIGIALASYLDWRTNDASKQRAREMIENFSCGGITEVETIKTNVLSYFQEYQILDPTADLLPDLPRRIGFEMEGDILGSYRGLDPNSPYIAVDPIVSFSNPFRGTLSESEWQNVQVILNQLPCTGDSTFAQYLENIFRSIQNNSSTDAQAAHYESIATVLQSIRTKIDIYAKRNQATSDIYVTGFCLWYNHVVNLAHQQLRRQLQLYINQGRDISHYPFLDGWNLLCPAGQTTTTINNTALSENALRYLRHISFDTSNNQFSYTLPQDVVGTRQICNSFSGNQNSAISRILLKNITQAQINLQSEIDYYRKLDAAAQVRYNSDSIVKIIEKLRAYCQQISNISACPEDTKTLYNNQVASLDTLLQFFRMQNLQKELEKAYDILCKCELEYHDWRVNQSSKTQFISKLNTEKNNTTWSSEIRAHITEIHSYVTVWAFPELNSSNYTHSTIGTILKHRVGIFGDLTRDQYACIEAFNALTRLVQSYYPRDEDDLPSAPTPLMYQISGRPAPQPATLNSSLDLVRRYRDGGFQLLTYIRPFFDNQLYNKGTGSTPDLSAYKKTTEAMNKICGSNFDNYGQNGIGLALKTYTTNNLNFATVIGEVQNLLKQNPHWRYNSQELTRQLRALLTKRIVTSGGVVSIKDYAEALGMQNDDHSVGIAGLETVAVDYGDRTIVNEGVSISVNNMELYILSLYQDILDYKPYEDPYYVYHERDEELRQRIYDTLTAREGSEALPTKVQACLDAATSPLATTGTGINVRTYLEGDLVDIPAFETKLQNSFDANRDLLKDFSADEILMMQMRIRDKILLKKDAGDTFDSNTIPNIIREVYKQYAVSNLILGQNKGDLLIGSGILDHSKTRQLIRVLQNLVTEWNQRDRSSNAVAYQIIAQEKAEQRAAEANEGEPNVQDAPKKEEFNPQDSFYTGSVLDIIEQLKDVASNGVGYSMIQKIDRQTRIAENIFSSTTLPITKLEWHWTTAGDANVSDDALSKQGFYTFSCGGIPFIAAQIEDNIKIVATNAGSTITTTAMSSSDYPDVHGVFYRQNPDGSISTTALTFDKAGLTYFTRNGIFFVEDADGEETELRYDEQGYVTDSNGHIIFDETMQSYRYDRITGDILQVDTGSITQNLGKVKINATYTPFIKATREYGSPEAYYLSRPETAEHFFNELSNIAVSFENQYSEWKTSVSSFSQNDNDLVIAKSMVQFSNMLSQLRDRMMRHDVRRYQERNSFSQENYIITEIDDRIKTLFQEGIFEKFSHLSRLAFDFYEVAYNLTYAEGHGFRDQVDTLLPSYKEKKTLYENALQAVIGEHGNFTTLLSDLEELKNEAESELTYNTSQAETLSDKVRFVVTAAYAHKKYEVAQQLWRIVQSANYVKQCIDTYGLQTSTPTGTYDSQSLTSTKLYAELADMIRSGAHTSTFYLMDPASVCASTIRTQYHEYQGRTGDSTDVDFHREVLRMLQSGIYFHNGEELHLIANPSLQVYLQEQCDVLETYGKKLRTYEIYAGMKKDGFFAVASVGGREILTGGIGLERILKQHPKWFFSKAEQQILIADLQSLHEHIESSLALYAETGPLVGQLDTQTYKAIRTFQDYLGNPKNPEKRTLLESVMSFETFDLLKFRGAVDYKRQAWQLFALEKGFNSGEMSFEKYKTAIENPGIYGGPLDSYIDDMRNYVAYLKAIREYLEALLLLTPKHYYYDTNLAEWQEVPNDASEEKLLEIDDKGGQYVRLVSGYNSSGQPVFLEQEGSTPEKPIHIYASRSAVWHGSHNHLTWEYQLMAILYEKFTTQRWKIQDMLSEVEEYNNKLAEANQILAQINTVQAAATKAGEEAKGVIPVDIQFYFQEHKIQSPSSNFTSREDMLYYQESPFGKRSDYLINECSAYPTGMLGYLIQDLIQDQGEGSTLPATLKAYDLLEMGSLYYIYHHQNEFSEATDINVDTVDSGDPYFGLGNLEHMKTFDSRSNVKERKLWEVYWNERKYYHEHPQEKLKSSVRKFVDNYTQGNIQSFKGDGISPFPSDSIGKNSTDHGMYRLKNTAPATNEWSGCGHYKYTAQRAAEAGGLLDTTYREDVNSKGFMEAMELVCHQKFYETSDANLTEPWYDWNAFLMIYKIEAMSDVYGYEVTDIAMQYLLGSKDANATRTALAALLDPNGTRKAAKKRVYSRNEMIDIMAYIDGEHLFSGTTDFADVPTERKEVLIYWWDHSHIGVQDGKIKGILDASMAAGATDLGADEVALWSENLRIHIDKLKSSQEVINTRMQRLLQRLNETTSLATQLLKVISESKKQSASNVR